MLVKGDKIVLKKKVYGFDNVGKVATVVNIVGDVIVFAFGESGMYTGAIDFNEFEEYFDKYEEPKEVKTDAPTVSPEHIEEIINNSKVIESTVFDKCTVVSVQLPNGFVITESSASVSPKNYDENTGIENCMMRIIDKVWELEGYRLQCELYEASEENKRGDEVDEDCYDCFGCDESDCCWHDECCDY